MKKILLTLVAVATAVTAAAGTVYFDNSTAGWSTVKCYTYNPETLGSWSGTEMTKMAGSSTVYQIDTKGETQNIIFNNGDQTQTGNLAYKAGNIYNENGIVGPAKLSTVYFVLGANDSFSTPVGAHLYNSTSSYSSWEKKPSMQSTGKYVKLADGEYHPVLSLTIAWTQTPENVIFHYNNSSSQTAAFAFHEGGFYTAEGYQSVYNAGCLVDKHVEVAGEKCNTLYMHFKEDYVKGGNQAVKPRCHVFRHGTSIQKSQFNTSAEDMRLVNADYGIWAFDLAEGDAEKYDDVTFYYHAADNDSFNQEYTAGAGDYFERSNWTTFVYSTASYTPEKKYAIQTYLTYDELEKIVSAPVEQVYLVGSGISGITWDPAQAKPYQHDANSFYIPVQLGSSDIEFKVSSVNVPAIKAKANQSLTCLPRDWATYDLGLFGVDDLHKMSGYNPTIDSNAQKVFFDVNKSISVLKYNQYNWTIKSGKVAAGNYWVVINAATQPHSLSLLSFDPNPTAEVKVSATEQARLTLAQAAALHEASEPFNAEAANGTVYIKDMNVCSGEVTITSTDRATITAADYDVDYNIYMDGSKVATYNGVPAALTIDYMPLSASSQVTMRATYTDRQTRLSFNSRTHTSDISGASVVPEAATVNAGAPEYVLESRGAGNHGNFGIYLPGISYSNSSALANYVDFRFEGGSNGGEIVDANHALVAYDENGFNADKAFPGWTKYNEGDYDHAIHNWSGLVANGQEFPVYIPGVHKNVAPGSNLPEYEVKGEVIAVYPFLCRTNPTLTVKGSAPRKALARVPEDMSGFKIHTVAVPTAVSGTASTVSDVMTGIGAIDADDSSDAPAEYFNLQGVRVEPAAPGLYIRRQGGKVAKIAIR